MFIIIMRKSYEFLNDIIIWCDINNSIDVIFLLLGYGPFVQDIDRVEIVINMNGNIFTFRIQQYLFKITHWLRAI